MPSMVNARGLLPFAMAAMLLASSASAQRGARNATPVGTIDHVWKPVRDGGADVVAIEVRTRLAGFPDSLGRTFSVTAPITYAGVRGIAARVQKLEVRDAVGAVTFR